MDYPATGHPRMDSPLLLGEPNQRDSHRQAWDCSGEQSRMDYRLSLKQPQMGYPEQLGVLDQMDWQMGKAVTDWVFLPVTDQKD